MFLNHSHQFSTKHPKPKRLVENSVDNLDILSTSISKAVHTQANTYRVKHPHTNKHSAASAGSNTLLNTVWVLKSESISNGRKTVWEHDGEATV